MTSAPRIPQPATTSPEEDRVLATVDVATADGAATGSGIAPLPAPRALLLDFGGVVISTTKRLSWARDLADLLLTRSAALGTELDRERVEASLRAGRTALSMWKNAASRRLAPRELTPTEIVGDFLLADLPDTARRALTLDAPEILDAMATLVADHHVRPGIHDLLTEADTRGLRLGIVSNAHSGRAHRRLLEQLGLADRFGVQIYSDEVGIRKPHPGMIHLAAEALAVDPARAWYVGDTLDRDVMAGRRAGVGAVVITRDRRTDHPPFPVVGSPDLVLETPEGLVEPMRTALDGADADGLAPATASDRDVNATRAPADGAGADETAAGAESSAAGAALPSATPRPGRPALLLDHGGVITLSTPNPHRNREIGTLIRELSERIGCPIAQATAERAVAEGWERHRARKRERDANGEASHRHEEIDPGLLWGDLVGADLPAPLRAALRLEGPQLSLALHRTKNIPAPRPGALELIRWCHEHGIVVGIVSNTISGRGVREILARYGVGRLIGPSAYSDEIGVRKPGREIFAAALAGLEADAADVVYVGDKALNDGRGGRDAGIGTLCLLRGGKDADEQLEAARAEGHADHVLDSPAEVIDLLAARLSASAPRTP